MTKVSVKKSKILAAPPAQHSLHAGSKSIGKNKKKDKKRKEGLESVIRTQNLAEAVKSQKSENENYVVKNKKNGKPQPATNGTKKNAKKRQQTEPEPAPKKPKPAQNGTKKKVKKSKTDASHQPGQFVRAPKADEDNVNQKTKKAKKKGKTNHISQFFEGAEDEAELRTGSLIRINKSKPGGRDLTLSVLDCENLSEISDGGEFVSDEEEESSDDSFSVGSEYSDEETSDDDLSYDEMTDSDEASSADSYENFFSGDSDEDTDYVPSEAEDDLYIGRGQAKIYDLNDIDVAFDSDEPQIKELPDGNESDDSCPTLVPIQSTDEPKADEPEDEIDLVRSLEAEEQFSLKGNAATLNEMRNSARFFKSKTTDQVLVLLMKPIHASGFLVATVVAGELEINGYRLRTGETREIYGVKHFPSQHLTPIGQSALVNWDPFAADFSEKQLSEMKSSHKSKETAVLVLKKMPPNARMSMLNTYLPAVLFKRVPSGTLRGCEFLLQTTFEPQTKCLQPLKVDPKWNEIQVERTSDRVVIVGGKNAGKSTLAQYLINRNVQKFERILLIDLDIGQPIVNVSQTVSATVLDGPILGAGYLNGNIKPDKAFYFGSVGVQSAPVKYIECVRSLLKYCHKQHNGIPWIVNTMGMVRGFGQELLVGIIKLARPDVVVQIQHDRADSDFSQEITAKYVNEYKFLLFQPDFGNTVGSKSDFKLEILKTCARGHTRVDLPMAKELRTLQTVAKLGDCLAGFEWLNDASPVSAHIDQLQVLTMDDQTLTGQIALKAINANLVYLCHRAAKETSDETTSSHILECLGIAVVRSVNFESGCVYLLPAVQLELMAKVNVLALGQTPLPECLLLKQSQSVEGFVPYIYNTDRETAVSKKTKKMQHYKT